MGKDGGMYMLTELPEEVDKMGNRVLEEVKLEEEGLPKVEIPNFRLVNSICIHQVLIDDTSRVLYQRTDDDTEFFYMRAKITKYVATQIKVLSVYVRKPMIEGQNMIMMDY